jgi:hypothetical protein
LATDPDAPTQALRRATRPLEEIPAAGDARWACGRCQGPVEPFSTGHYVSTCFVTLAEEGFHFCCPCVRGCELQAS